MRQALLLIIAISIVAAAESGNDLFQKALVKERTEGNLAEAIQLYQRITQKFGSNRKLAAKALFQMAQCYEKQGNVEARKAYERLLRDYADQAEAGEARTRLAALGTSLEPRAGSGVKVRQLWVGPEVDIQGAVSPDGRYLSFMSLRNGVEELAIRDLVTGQNRVLTRQNKNESAEVSVFSPDGRQIAYAVDNDNPEHGYELRIISVEGGAPRVPYTYTKGVSNLAPHAWSPEGKSILTVLMNHGEAQLAWIPVAGGSPRILKTFTWPLNLRAGPPRASLSPDGRSIAYEVQPDLAGSTRDIFVMSADGSSDHALVESRWDDYLLGWTPDGKSLLFGSDRSGTFDTWMLPVADGKPQGQPALVRRDTGEVRPIGFTRGGSFYYGTRLSLADVYLAAVDTESGKLLTPPSAVSLPNTRQNILPAWSPDGRRLAYYTARQSRNRSILSGIVVRSVETGQEQELRPGVELRGTRLGWTPDSQFLIAHGHSREGLGIHRIHTETGKASLVAECECWSPDGKATIAFGMDRLSLRWRDLETGREQTVFQIPEGQYFGYVALSPDGRQMALLLRSKPGYGSSDSILVAPSSGGEPREVYRDPNGAMQRNHALAWSPDGRWVFFVQRTNSRSELWRVPAAGGEAQKLDLSMPGDIALNFHPDGRRIAFSSGDGFHNEVWEMENFLSPPPARHGR